MANFFDKMKEWNKEVTKKIDERAEKRRSSVTYYMDKTKAEMKDAERMVEKQRELKSLFYKEYKEMETYVEKRRRQVEIAEEAGETKLAEFAKAEVTQYEEQLQTTKGHYEQASKQLEDLELRMHEMRLKWKNLKTQHLAEMAEKNAAETSEKMDKVIHDMSWGSVSDYHEAQKQRDLAEEANKKADMAKELSQSFDELMDELEKKTAKSKEVIKDKAQDFTSMVDDIIEREKQNFKKKDQASMEELLNDLEKEAKKKEKKEDKETLIPELEKKDEEKKENE
ncbi:PspA/IM30 family protein [Listeria fleischmannii]|uniref:PspA/IM30 family protein n=1 Tax=Listeria fleischmannii TaxID=1069827 RepID=A0A841YFA8_9LIST|nr:PspA/IM30 family protein [Listeria fleischmannii]MBC1398864.1 PspA/IM30 family protein [Listeria fleischmannii]MBC1427117.1 PspA/IM30 family protein [Listeria fleischmannii]